MQKRGFTLIEILLVVGLVVIIGVFTVPATVNLYNTQISKSTTDEVFSALKKAQAFALYRRNNSDYGVYFDSGNDIFVLFEGDGYGNNPTQDEESDLNGVTITLTPDGENPPDTIYFAKGTGIPSWDGIITLTKGAVTETISVCSDSGTMEFGQDCHD